jgi:hypothetical protein
VCSAEFHWSCGGWERLRLHVGMSRDELTVIGMYLDACHASSHPVDAVGVGVGVGGRYAG